MVFVNINTPFQHPWWTSSCKGKLRNNTLVTAEEENSYPLKTFAYSLLLDLFLTSIKSITWQQQKKTKKKSEVWLHFILYIHFENQENWLTSFRLIIKEVYLFQLLRKTHRNHIVQNSDIFSIKNIRTIVHLEYFN